MALICKRCGIVRELTPKSEYEAIRLKKVYCVSCARSLGKKKGSKYVDKVQLGSQFSNWTVSGNFVADGSTVECTCICGTISHVRVSRLVSGKSTRCKKTCMIGKFSSNWKGIGDVPSSAYTRIKLRAKSRNIPFTVSFEYLANLFVQQNSSCALSNLPIDFIPINDHNLSGSMGTASLDRIDSSRGYEEENVQWVHKHVNAMKLDHDESYFLYLCQQIANHAKT